MENADNCKDANPWHPMTDQKALKFLGKLSEECGELTSAISRCIIQGLNEAEPVTGKINRQWLLDELADVSANIGLVQNYLELSFVEAQILVERVKRKRLQLQKWHDEAVEPPRAWECEVYVAYNPSNGKYKDWMRRIFLDKAVLEVTYPPYMVRNIRPLR